MNPFDSHIAALQRKYGFQPTGQIVFYGSSSIRLWPFLTREFPNSKIENWGFGGSNLRACAHFFERAIVPRAPSGIVFYAGDNDLANGAEPSEVWESLRALLDVKDARLPQTQFAFLSLKPSPSRLELRSSIEQANEWCEREISARQSASWVDVFSPMLGEDGWGRRELFMADMLHLSRAGYEVWNAALRNEILWMK
jgi:lysophospholipase L1-like esterase